jgi:hypothetical protein
MKMKRRKKMSRTISRYKLKIEYTWDNGDTGVEDITHLSNISPQIIEATLDDIESNNGEGDGEYN